MSSPTIPFIFRNRKLGHLTFFSRKGLASTVMPHAEGPAYAIAEVLGCGSTNHKGGFDDAVAVAERWDSTIQAGLRSLNTRIALGTGESIGQAICQRPERLQERSCVCLLAGLYAFALFFRAEFIFIV